MTDQPQDPKSIVQHGYDAVSYAYRGDVEDEHCKIYHAWLDELLPEVPRGAPVLDLGCGNGVPVTRRLACDYAVTGIDLSEVQIERARKNVLAGPGLPAPVLLQADMTELDFPAESFAAITSFYAIIHIPLEEQPALLRKIQRWLRPGGLFMATVGHRPWTGTEDNWLDAGAAMYWSHTGAETYIRWLEEAGLHARWSRFVPEGNGGHTLVMAENFIGGNAAS